jgi:hypothetical protein
MPIINNPANAIKYQECHPLINLILELGELNKFKEDESLWFSLNNDLKTNKFLWYPSAFLDITDILFVDDLNFPEFQNESPNVYIHSDPVELYFLDYHLNEMFQNNQVEIINQSCIESNNSKIKLFHLRNGEKYLWLIYFCNYNELLMELFLKFSIYSIASKGNVCLKENNKVSNGSAGYYSKQGKKPCVRGVAMNPVDHPNGGGEGRSKSGGGRQHLLSPWGHAKGEKTRKKYHKTDRFIVQRRNAKKGK